MKKLLSIVWLCSSSLSLASCPDINFYETNNVINQLPVAHQGDMNTCYAHALSTAYNIDFDQTEENRLHPYWLAFLHKDTALHYSPRNLNFSVASWAWGDLKKQGYCDYSVVQQKLDRLKNNVPYSNDQLIYLLSKFFQKKTWNGVQSDRAFKVTVDQLVKQFRKEADSTERPWVREEMVQILNPLRKEVKGKSFFKWLRQSVFNECKNNINHRPNQLITSTGRAFESNTELALQMDAMLAQNSPVVIGYCNSIYKTDDDITNRPRIAKAINLKCSAHYSVIVGSRSFYGNCQYLLRNSYGTGFWGKPSMTCWCKDKALGVNRNCYATEANPNLEVLGCWIDKNKLLTNTFDLAYFAK